MATTTTLHLSLSLLLLLLHPLTSSGSCHRDDRKALNAVRSALGNPSKLASWLPSSPCCEWTGVICSSVSNRVTDLSIAADPNITAEIPLAISGLRFLQRITLSELPNLTGPISPVLTLLPHLTSIDLSSNGLSGAVPTFLSSITKLEFLDLSNNKLTGSIPHQLSSLPHLASLNLAGNRLTGPIPESFGYFPAPFSLFLSGNLLTGPVPRSLASVDFAVLDLSWNKLRGDASFLLRPSNSTWAIYLSGNMFEFDLSGVEFPWKLLLLDIRKNRIYGRIPPQIAELPELRVLNVSYNRLCGKIPTGGRLGHFDETSYSHNRCLCGTPLPPCK